MACPEIRCVLPGSGAELYLKTITTSQQRIISKAYDKEDTVLLERIFDDILRECVVDDIDPLSLYSRDRHYALMQLRLESIRGDYVINTTCPECGKKREIAIELGDFDFSEIILPISEEVIQLSNNLKLILGHMTRADEMDMSKYVVERKKLSGNIEEDVISNIEFLDALCACCIKVVVFGEKKETPSFEDKMSILNELNPNDYAMVRDAVLNFDTVDEISFNIDCSDDECRHRYVETIEWMRFFYRMMSGDINFEVIFNEIGSLCFSEQLGFTKEDVDNMPPFERQAYIDFFAGLMKEQERNMKEGSKGDGKITAHNDPFANGAYK